MYKHDEGRPLEIHDIINAYNVLVKEINGEARLDEERAYGGIVRAGKGLLVESIAKNIIKIAWKDHNANLERLTLERKTINIPLKKEYLERIENPEVKEYIKNNLNKFHYPLKTDVHVHIDKKFVIAVECKAYTENAMLKRILVDFTLFKQIFPNLDFVLFQLESQLGGDYSKTDKIIYGSPSTHTLLSYFDIDLNIITLLEGERKVDQPIHKKKYYKPLNEKSMIKAIGVVKILLQKYK